MTAVPFPQGRDSIVRFLLELAVAERVLARMTGQFAEERA